MADTHYSDDSEIWRDIPGWPHYQASSNGRIRSISRTHLQNGRGGGKVLKHYPGRIRRHSVCPKTGYCKVGLCIEGKPRTAAVHVLICAAFHGPRPDRHDAAHTNGIRSDNRPENLRWCTRKENLADRVAHGTMNTGKRNGMSHHARRLRAALVNEEA